MRSTIILAAVPLSLLLYMAGCGGKSASEGNSRASQSPPTLQITNGDASHGSGDRSTSSSRDTQMVSDEHGHKAGEHGGLIVQIGRDNYHAEAVFEKGGTLRIHILGKDEGKIQEVESQSLTGYVRPAEGGEAISFQLEPEQQPDDSEGKTSVFVGRLPDELRGKSVDVTIPSIRINGERFRFAVKMTIERHDADMPSKVNDAEEEALYLTPGGIYTAADIEANGHDTASRKFQGLMSSHDMKPKSGDKICPVTMTKANPKFTWIVAGKTYEFCCPPCVDEFVKTAKERPEEIKPPDEYVKP